MAHRRLADLDQHQKARDLALAATSADRQALTRDLEQLDTALHVTRVERVHQLADRPTQLHVEILGPPPSSTGGRAVWCHQAMRLEHHLDHNNGDHTSWQRLVDNLGETPTLARSADRHITNQPQHELRPADWAGITHDAEATHVSNVERARTAPNNGPEIELSL